MSMSRIDQSLGRGSASSCRAQRKPVNVTGMVGDPDDYPAGEGPRSGSEHQRNEARHGDGQPEVPHAEGPLDRHHVADQRDVGEAEIVALELDRPTGTDVSGMSRTYRVRSLEVRRSLRWVIW